MAIFEHMAKGVGELTAPRGDNACLTVLLYHRVLSQLDPLQPYMPDAAQFDAQLAGLAQVFRIVPLEDALSRLRAGTLPPRALSITFDDGYRDNIDLASPILMRHGLTATFFIATGFLDGGRMMHDTVIETIRRLPDQTLDLEWIGMGKRPIVDLGLRLALINEFVGKVKYLPFQERLLACERLGFEAQSALPSNLMMTSKQVRRLAESGMSVGAHTHDHPILARIPSDEAWTQIVKSRDVLTSVLGSVPALFAYPNGKPNADYGSSHVELVKRSGFSGAVSVSAGVATRNSDQFQLPRFVPWDRNPKRLVLRILAHPWRHRRAPIADPCGRTTDSRWHSSLQRP